jgi:hypothetical protein
MVKEVVVRSFLYACSALALVLVLGSCVAEDDPVADETSELKAGAHFVGTPTCEQSGNALTCAGSIAGLGNRAVTVELLVQRVCTNRGGNNPPGLVKSFSEPITPENGRINFSVTAAAGCPDQMTATFLSPATINVFQGQTLVFTGQISF